MKLVTKSLFNIKLLRLNLTFSNKLVRHLAHCHTLTSIVILQLQ